MVTLGNGEADLGWSFFLDRHHSDGIGQPRLPGFPSYEESTARYEELTGRPAKNVHFYEVFSGFRFGCVMMRLAQQMEHYEVMDEATARRFEFDNTVTKVLAQLL